MVTRGRISDKILRAGRANCDTSLCLCLDAYPHMHLRGWRHVRILVCLTKDAAAGPFCSLILKNGPVMVTFPSTGFCPRWSQIFLCRFINTSYSRCFQHHRLPREGFSVGFSIFAKLTGHKGVFFTFHISHWRNPFKFCSSVSGLLISFEMSEVTLLSGKPDTS